MPKFFIENIKKDYFKKEIMIEGDLYNHIIKSLRMKKDEKLIICDGAANDYLCKIKEINKNHAKALIISKSKCSNELDLKIHLYQAIPKGSKLEQIIQKSVELGVYDITPIVSKRCVSLPKKSSIDKKIERWQKISKSAAEQSGRGIIPKINRIIDFETMVKNLKDEDNKIIFYECFGDKINKIISSDIKEVSVIIGSEGGFSPQEIEKCKKNNISIATLGKRILRCETAPIVVLSIFNYLESLK